MRAALPASQVPALDRADAERDDPEDLLEQADALRDTEDKVRERLKALHGRITEVREERDLDRRMNDFLGEESMFDEQDRRLRAAARTPARRRRGGAQLQRPRQRPLTSRGRQSGDAAPPSPPGCMTRRQHPPARHRRPTARASDRPARRWTPCAPRQLAAGDSADLAALEAEAAKLESLARELDCRANTLERRARELE